MADLVAAGRITKPERRNEQKITGRLKKKKDGHGLLILAHPTIEKLSNPIHCVKNYKSKLYAWVNGAKAKRLTCKAYAMQLSQDLA
jgi:hypothetical protein